MFASYALASSVLPALAALLGVNSRWPESGIMRLVADIPHCRPKNILYILLGDISKLLPEKPWAAVAPGHLVSLVFASAVCLSYFWAGLTDSANPGHIHPASDTDLSSMALPSFTSGQGRGIVASSRHPVVFGYLVDSNVNTVLKPATASYHMPSRAISGVVYRYLATPR